jgi:three-Cys-motif partner protein
MRNNGIGHHFIDACAGSGRVQDYVERKLIDGSPVRMAMTRSVVDGKIRDKSKKNEAKCWFIEVNDSTFSLLKANVEPFAGFSTCVHGDANVRLESVLEEVGREFALVYVDPFGIGDPVLRYETIQSVLERPYTELLIHYSYQGVDFSAAQLQNIDHPDPVIRQTARTTVNTLDMYLGGPEWHDVWSRAREGGRRKAMLDFYLSELGKHYTHVMHLEMPPGSPRPYFDLVFVTRNDTANKIMKDIMDSKRRRSSSSLEEWF